jgi:hypothetical protein
MIMLSVAFCVTEYIVETTIIAATYAINARKLSVLIAGTLKLMITNCAAPSFSGKIPRDIEWML